MSAPETIAAQRLPVIRHLKRTIAAFQSDRRLERAGYSLVFAVDFAAIFAYIHRTFEATFIERLPQEDKHRQFARLQMALDVVFESKAKKLVLIPPYAIELTNHIQLLRENYDFEAFAVRRQMEQQIQHGIADLPLFKRFVRTADRPGTPASQESMQDMLLELSKKHYPELLILARLVVIKALKTLASLISDGVLPSSVPFLFPTQEAEPLPDMTTVQYWLRQMNALREGKRPYQSLIDAKACAYILAANRVLKPQKHVLLFFTPSQHVQKTFGSETMEVITGVRSTLVRDLDYFLLTLLENIEGVGVDDRLVSLGPVLDDLESVYAEKQTGKAFSGEIAQTFLREDNSWREIENLLVTIEQSGTRRHNPPVKTDLDRDVLKTLNTLLTFAADKPDAIREEVERLFAQVSVHGTALERFVRRPQSLKLQRYMEFEFTQGAVEIRFKGLPAEMPFTIRFCNRTVRRLVRDLKLARGDEAIYSSVQVIVATAAEDVNAVPEQLLLAGCVSAMEAKWNTAIALLVRGLRKAKGVTRTETLFLLALVHRKLFDSQPAEQYISAALESAPDDPRVLIESANVTWLDWHRTGRRPGSVAVDAFQRALADLEKAEEVAANANERLRRDLMPQIWNLRAFFYTELAAVYAGDVTANVEAAGKALQELSVLSEETWLSRFLDTRGWYYFVKARLSTDWRLRKADLALAVRDFARAMEDPLLVPQKRMLIESHFDEAHLLLEELVQQP